MSTLNTWSHLHSYSNTFNPKEKKIEIRSFFLCPVSFSLYRYVNVPFGLMRTSFYLSGVRVRVLGEDVQISFQPFFFKKKILSSVFCLCNQRGFFEGEGSFPFQSLVLSLICYVQYVGVYRCYFSLNLPSSLIARNMWQEFGWIRERERERERETVVFLTNSIAERAV